jgi:hypothetical protein
MSLFLAPTAPDQWTSVPLLVKVYKLLVYELSNQIERSMSTRGTAGDEDEVVVCFDGAVSLPFFFS